MNSIISDTAEYGCYLFSNEAKPLLKDYVDNFNHSLFHRIVLNSNQINDEAIQKINKEIVNHPVEIIGLELRKSMTSMKNLF